jgi:hypothetical protein
MFVGASLLGFTGRTQLTLYMGDVVRQCCKYVVDGGTVEVRRASTSAGSEDVGVKHACDRRSTQALHVSLHSACVC